jgi:hypothetical protein
MKLSIQHQESYSRGELLLRSFFGWAYIAIPHLFLLFFVSIWSAIIQFIAFWTILFTGTFPKGLFIQQVGIYRWSLRFTASLSNLVDGYPEFGIGTQSNDKVTFEVEYPDELSRGKLLLRAFFGIFYVIIPHFFLLIFVGIWISILQFLAWWVVLFTGKYPPHWHNQQVEYLRWNMRLSIYLSYMTDEYPRFNGRE